MALTDEAIENELVGATTELFKQDPDGITVNSVRKLAVGNLKLDDAFFKGDDWKQRSKILIKDTVEKLHAGWSPQDAATGMKRESPETAAPEVKLPKHEPTKLPVKKEEPDASSEDEDKKPSRKQRVKKRAVDSDDDIAPTLKASPSPDRKRKRIVKEDPDKEHKVKARRHFDKKDRKPKLPRDEDTSDEEDQKQPTKAEDDSDGETKPKQEDLDEAEEYSDVIDESPKPKRKKKDKSSSSHKSTSKPSKSPKTSSKATGASDDPEDAEIKKLQTQLSKCGIRKFWHNELKQYGDNGRAKIRHLKGMLADAGMDGRFSEAKAREIKERRELLADAEAAQEMNELWGVDGGGRSSRSKSKGKGKSLKVEETDGSGEENGGGDGGQDEDEEEDMSFAARRRRAQADLAFLDDESDSD